MPFCTFFFIFKYCVNFALLPTFIFTAFCLILLEVRRLEQLSHLLVASKPVFAFLTLCMCDCCVRVYVFVCCQLCLVAALIVFVRCPRLLHCNDPPPSTASSFVLTFALLVFVVIEHRPCRALFHTHTLTLSLSLGTLVLSNSHFEVAKQTKSTVANLRARQREKAE